MILWDLTKGKLKLKKKCRSDTVCIKWDLKGEHYLILCDTSLAIFSISDDKPLNIITFEDKVVDFDFITKEIVRSVGETGDESESEQSQDKEGDDVSYSLNDFKLCLYLMELI